MNTKFSIAILAAFHLTCAHGAETSCADAVEKLAENAKREPKTLLVALEKAIIESADCECELVTTAVKLAGDDISLIADIVAVAAAISPNAAATVTECALAEAPEAAAEIRQALSETFEGAKAPVATHPSKEPISGKEAIYVEPTDDFAPAPKTVSGVYLIAPVAPAAATGDRELLAHQLGITTKELDRLLSKGGKTFVDVLKRRPKRERDPRDDSTPSQQTP